MQGYIVTRNRVRGTGLGYMVKRLRGTELDTGLIIGIQGLVYTRLMVHRVISIRLGTQGRGQG